LVDAHYAILAFSTCSQITVKASPLIVIKTRKEFGKYGPWIAEVAIFQ
jgi:hypothetical protein